MVDRLLAVDSDTLIPKQKSQIAALGRVLSPTPFMVDQFGASGNGSTDDTTFIQQALDAANTAGGGRVLFGSGKTYATTGSMLVGSNTIVDLNGATILKQYTGSQTSTVFVNRVPSGATGYGSGAQNITIRNGRIKGSFTAAGVVDAATGWHHVDNLNFHSVVFEEAQQNAHSIDLGGCRNVKIVNCTFRGHKIVSGREFVEAIQIDSSSYAGSPYKAWPTNSYDGLPTRGVLVDGCTFTTLVVGSTTYDMPNAIGSHGAVLTTDSGYYESIRFTNNHLEGYNNGPADGATLAYGWLHFRGVRGAVITGNTFRYVGPVNGSGYPTVINFMPVTSAIPASDVASSSPSSATVDPPRQSTGITIAHNIFTGFANAQVKAGASLIYLRIATNADVSFNSVDGASCSVVVAASATTGSPGQIDIDSNNFQSSASDPAILMQAHILSSIDGNSLKIGTGSIGVRVDDGLSNFIANNTINGGDYGVFVTASANSTITGNILTTQAKAGVLVGPSSASVTAFDWIVSNNRARSTTPGCIGFINGPKAARTASFGNFWSCETAKTDTGTETVANAHLDR